MIVIGAILTSCSNNGNEASTGEAETVEVSEETSDGKPTEANIETNPTEGNTETKPNTEEENS